MSRRKIQVELGEKDVQKDIGGIVNAMSMIRAEAMSNKKISDKQKDEYLHLTERLATTISTISGDESKDGMNLILKKVEKDERLLCYDAIQYRYWAAHQPAFQKTLDKLVITSLKDDFHDMDSRHHFFQAVKYLGVQDSDFDEKERVFNTILPYSGKIKGFGNQSLLKKVFGKILGYSYKIKEDTDLKLTVKGKPQFLPELLKEAGSIGYTELETDMFTKDFEKLKEMGIEGKAVKELDGRLFNEAQGRVLGKFIKWTSPITYPILGSFSGKLMKKLEGYTDNEFDGRYALNTSNWIVGLGGAGLFAVGIEVSSWFIGLTGAYCVVESVFRGAIASGDSRNGADPEKMKISRLAFLPLNYVVQKINNSLDARGTYLNTRFKIKNNDVAKQKLDCDDSAAFGYFTKLAELSVPTNLEDNLVWNTGNHNNFAKELADYISGEAKDIIPQDLKFDVTTDRKNQKYNLFISQPVGGYDKFTMLAFSKGERYVLSFVKNHGGTDKVVETNDAGNNSNNLDRDMEYIAQCNRIISSNSTLEDKAKQLTTKLSTHYTHVLRYDGKDSQEFMVTN